MKVCYGPGRWNSEFIVTNRTNTTSILAYLELEKHVPNMSDFSLK
jgi:hypothetical protein